MAINSITIGKLAAAAGVNLETIRYYERIGLMPEPPRTASNQRDYEPSDIRRLSFIRRARELGFTLDEIRGLLALSKPGHRSCADVSQIAGAHLHDVRAKIKHLRKLERILSETVGKCSGRKVPACPVLDMLSSAA
jgi:MerR family mercuric resistance operon transcriptional regulator